MHGERAALKSPCLARACALTMTALHDGDTPTHARSVWSTARACMSNCGVGITMSPASQISASAGHGASVRQSVCSSASLLLCTAAVAVTRWHSGRTSSSASAIAAPAATSGELGWHAGGERVTGAVSWVQDDPGDGAHWMPRARRL